MMIDLRQISRSPWNFVQFGEEVTNRFCKLLNDGIKLISCRGSCDIVVSTEYIVMEWSVTRV